MQTIAYLNGVFAPIEETKISIDDRGFIFGDGVYEALLAFNHIPFGMQEHIDRFFNSLKLLEIQPPYSKEELAGIIQEAIDRVEGDRLLVYYQATRGTSPRAHIYPKDVPANFMLTVRQGSDMSSYMKNGGSAILQDDTRWKYCNIKTINLIPAVMATQRANEAGCIEAILQRDGFITEGASSNIFVVHKGVVRTAPLSNQLLPGITRGHVLELASDLKIPVEEVRVAVQELENADEVFATSVSKRVVPIVKIDGKLVGDGSVGPVSRRLQQAYQRKVDGICGPLK